jgi:UDP:flavonoid glycosyltransferase YjiC (YdhE family)
MGAPELPDNMFHPHSPYLNLYVYPTELDYQTLGNTWEMKTWMQINCLIEAKPLNKFKIPPNFGSRPGKLIYISMGPYASVDVMKRLTKQLSETPHKYVVSKGPLHDQYDLPDNMWGAEDVPLEDVLLNMDLIICSGDTKTVSKCFFYGKPLIILPLFGEQLDNRNRFKELGFGWGLDPFTCNKETLFGMINNTVDDPQLPRRLNLASNVMQTAESCKQITDRIAKILNKTVDEEEKVVEPPLVRVWEDPQPICAPLVGGTEA